MKTKIKALCLLVCAACMLVLIPGFLSKYNPIEVSMPVLTEQRAAAQEQAFEEFEREQRAAAASEEPEAGRPARKPSPAPQFEAQKPAGEPVWGDEDDDEPQEPVRKPKKTGKSKKKKKKGQYLY